MPEVWICGDCRSVNTARQGRCYRCRMPRATAELQGASEAMSRSEAQSATTVLARAARLGATYHATWPLALLTGVLVVASMLTYVGHIQAFRAVLGPGWALPQTEAQVQPILDSTLRLMVVGIAAIVSWSTWIALVIRNLPALTGRWSPNTPLGAFVAPIIPIIGLKRPYTVVRNALAILSGRPFPSLIALAWWLAMLAAYFGPVIASFTFDPALSLGQQVVAMLDLQVSFLAIAAGLAIGVLLVVELEQRRALRLRATVVYATAGPDPGRV